MIKKFQSKITEKKNLTDSVIYLKLQVPENFSFVPGQYVSLIVEKNGGKIRRPFSIAGFFNGEIELCIKIVENGLFSSLIPEIKENDEITVLGPLGDFKIENLDKNLVFVCHGAGIAPFKVMIKDLLKKGFHKQITLIAGYRYEKDVLYNNEFLDLQKKFKNFCYFPTLTSPEDGWKGKTGRVQKVVEEIEFDKNSDFYLCGLKEMVFSVRALLSKKGFAMKDIFVEKYD